MYYISEQKLRNKYIEVWYLEYEFVKSYVIRFLSYCTSDPCQTEVCWNVVRLFSPGLMAVESTVASTIYSVDCANFPWVYGCRLWQGSKRLYNFNNNKSLSLVTCQNNYFYQTKNYLLMKLFQSNSPIGLSAWNIR